MKPGDTLVVHEGTYRESVSITKSGSKNAPIVVKAGTGENAVISGLDILNLTWMAA